MINVVFEFEPVEDLKHRYFELATALREEVGKIEGFISVERFESISTAGRFVSLSAWEDLAAVQRWREHLEHNAAQDEAKSRNIFRDYRIRVAEVVRDYGKEQSA